MIKTIFFDTYLTKSRERRVIDTNAYSIFLVSLKPTDSQELRFFLEFECDYHK
jgi:hypothetical protein